MSKVKQVGAFIIFALIAYIGTVQAAPNDGEALFNKHCAACHPNGGNIIEPNKTLSKKHREKNGKKTVDNIIKMMRSPTGAGMAVFDENSLPDKEAKKIAEYIINTFK